MSGQVLLLIQISWETVLEGFGKNAGRISCESRCMAQMAVKCDAFRGSGNALLVFSRLQAHRRGQLKPSHGCIISCTQSQKSYFFLTTINYCFMSYLYEIYPTQLDTQPLFCSNTSRWLSRPQVYLDFSDDASDTMFVTHIVKRQCTQLLPW